MSNLLPYQMPERQEPKPGYRYVVQGEYIEKGTRATWIGKPCEVVDALYISYFMDLADRDAGMIGPENVLAILCWAFFMLGLILWARCKQGKSIHPRDIWRDWWV